jgi:AraC-like DNA-binding protein
MPHHSQVSATCLTGVHITLSESAKAFPRHWHANFGVGMIDDGAQRSWSGRGCVEAFAGQVITHNPGEVHDGRPIGDRSRRWRMLHIEPDAMARLLGQTSVAAMEWTQPVAADPRLADALRATFEIHARQQRPVHEDTSMLTSLFDEALLRAIGRFALAAVTATHERENDPRGLARVMERLCDAPLETPTLDELATLGGLSRYALVRQFGRHYGLPPLAWLQQLRLESARTDIGKGTSLAEAAAASGFSDQSHLTRQFVRKFGYTPGAWRRATRGAWRHGTSARAISF